MNKTVRVLIAFIFVLGIVVVAKGNVAWAASSPMEAQSAPAQVESAPPMLYPEPGTVKPPAPVITITSSGVYSIGGFCSITVKNLVNGFGVNGSLFYSKLKPLPKDAGQILFGSCFLQYFKFLPPPNVELDKLPSDKGSADICFAVPPGKQGKVYFYDVLSGNPVWTALETTLKNGFACAASNMSGGYALVGK